MGIHYKIAGLGLERRAVAFPEDDAALGEGFDFPRRTTPAEWNHFNGKGKRSAEHRNALGVIDQHDKLFGRGCDDFFFQERPASALDQVEGGIDLISAVYGYVDGPAIVLIDQDDAAVFGQRR